MTFNVFAIRSGDDIGDDHLFPELSPHGERYPIQLSAEDTNVASFVAKSVRVNRTSGAGRKIEVLKVVDVRLDVLLTGSRVIFHCEKYDKGGGWGGLGAAGVAVSVVANGVSKARAAIRRRGKALVGQIRYPWLVGVVAKPKKGLGTNDQLTLLIQDSEGETVGVEVSFAKGTPVLGMARDIAQRAARHRLENRSEISEADRAELAALVQTPERPPGANGYAQYAVPSFVLVSSGVD